MPYILAVKMCELIRISQLNSKTLQYQDIWYLLSNQFTTIGIHGKYFVRKTLPQVRHTSKGIAKGTKCDTGEVRYGGD